MAEQNSVQKREMDYTEKVKEMGRHANALIALHLKKPDEFDKEWLFNKLLDQYEVLGLDIDNQESEEESEK